MFLPFFFFILLPCVWQGHFFFRAFLKGIQCWIEMYVFMEVLVTYKNALILSTQLEGFFFWLIVYIPMTTTQYIHKTFPLWDKVPVGPNATSERLPTRSRAV